MEHREFLHNRLIAVNTGKDISNVGYLIVKLIRATNLPSKKIGSMDPYVVMEIENCRSISPVREDCLEPEWNLTYRYSDLNVSPRITLLHVNCEKWISITESTLNFQATRALAVLVLLNHYNSILQEQ